MVSEERGEPNSLILFCQIGEPRAATNTTAAKHHKPTRAALSIARYFRPFIWQEPSSNLIRANVLLSSSEFWHYLRDTPANNEWSRRLAFESQQSRGPSKPVHCQGVEAQGCIANEISVVENSKDFHPCLESCIPPIDPLLYLQWNLLCLVIIVINLLLE